MLFLGVQSIEAWEAGGAKNIRQKALIETKERLLTQFPEHISEDLDQMIRNKFDIALPKALMKPDKKRADLMTGSSEVFK